MEAMITILREVRDPRDCTARHDLADMLFVSLVATLCGVTTCTDYAHFAADNLEELREFVDLANGAPSHDCFSRTFRLLDPVETEAAMRRFATALREGLGLGPPAGVVAFDGKRLRGAYERGRSHMPPLLVSVWDAETRVSLAAVTPPPGAKPGNEVAAALAALKHLDLKRCTVTADALHCHPAMTAAVIERGADYAIRLKANNAPLFNCAVAAFAAAETRGPLRWHKTEERRHDRQEWRLATIIPAPPDAPHLPGLRAFGRIESERSVGGRPAKREVHYVALSQLLTPQRLAEVFRAHWSVENHLHRQLDVVFREDQARSRKNHAPTNLSVIRRMALDILRACPDSRPIRYKMNRARGNRDYLVKLFSYVR